MMTLWIFGYGSLMWRPGFRYEQVARARLAGFSRQFCIYSVHHRGCEARPGLVLGLDQGGFCEGLAYRIHERDVTETVAYLRSREQVNGVYREAQVMIDVDAAAADQAGSESAGAIPPPSHTWRHVPALTYLVERAHPSYAARLPLAVQARFIRGARGRSGNNLDYLVNTLAHLKELGIREREMERLAVLSGLGLRVQTAKDAERLLASDCPRLMGVTRAASLLPLSYRTLRPLERRRFGYRRMLS